MLLTSIVFHPGVAVIVALPHIHSVELGLVVIEWTHTFVPTTGDLLLHLPGLKHLVRLLMGHEVLSGHHVCLNSADCDNTLVSHHLGSGNFAELKFHNQHSDVNLAQPA